MRPQLINRAKETKSQILDCHKRRFEGLEMIDLCDLLEPIKVHYPDVIHIPPADTRAPPIVKRARRHGLEPILGRTVSLTRFAPSRSIELVGRVRGNGTKC